MSLRLSAYLVVFLGSLLQSGTAHAQYSRTWISGVGDDVNPCSRTAPCKTWAGAISKTVAGGEIDTLDAGDFGHVTITKTITLDGSGAMSSILTTSANAINVAANANDVVTIRGISINGLGASTNGINVASAKAVYIEDSAIFGYTTGINFDPSTAAALYVKNVAVRSNGTGISVGATSSVALDVTMTRAFVTGNALGIKINGAGPGAVASIYDSVIAGSSTYAVQSVGSAQINIERGIISGSAVGIQADAGVVRLADVMTSQNATALVTNGGSITSFGNNRVSAGNASDGSISATLPLQ